MDCEFRAEAQAGASEAGVRAARQVMGFENDIFISYAHIDNQPLTQGQEGWISDFHTALEIRLGQLRGERPRIWRDLKLQGNDDFGLTIVEQFPKVALLVSVLSPRYVRSEWCVRELKEFCRAAEQTGGVRVANKVRIFKVIKTPIPQEQHPEELQPLLGYEFYQVDQTGRRREFNRIFGPEAERNYWAKLDDLSQDIHQLLDTLSIDPNGPLPQVAAPTGTTIYLAETTSDLSPERDKIRRELQQRGHVVLPDQPLPYSPEFEQSVREYLARCTLSIHLVGGRYGIVPEGAERSVVVLQHQLALERDRRDPAFTRLVWMPPDAQVQEPRQAEFLQALQDDSEVLQTSLEELKTLIQDRLSLGAIAKEPMLSEAGPARVYLICDQRDLEAIEPLESYLWDQGFEVLPSLFEGDEAEVRQYHQDSLRDCDAALIYYGAGSELWLRTKLRELQKAAGYGRSSALLAKAVYVAGSETPQKQRFRTNEALVIKSFEAFSATALKPFEEQVLRDKGALR
ncbi:DUF4062 domain-containing protein [Leptolyngbya sp. FACHB-261]|uniref:DUF4062 domain-containing protein n=1 Tax=Leptolyngbya sp. FACHB-261 TaxID=2692806 RepID=UPI0016863183|nr:DUF4062 domain-containing protein [Leptolyngbya sp. FACHB-261]